MFHNFTKTLPQVIFNNIFPTVTCILFQLAHGTHKHQHYKKLTPPPTTSSNFPLVKFSTIGGYSTCALKLSSEMFKGIQLCYHIGNWYHMLLYSTNTQYPMYSRAGGRAANV